jgi:hypothetical protein
MKKLAAAAVLSFLFASGVQAFGVTPPPQPRREILGIKVGMGAEAARSQLQKIGRLGREERKRQEVWEVSDPKFSGVIVGFDKAGRVRFVTAVARPGGERVRYGDVGDVKKARQKGNPAINNFRYEWEVAASGREPKIIVEASGRDQQYLSTYSIKRAQ